ncbi:MAG: 6-carboxytetrahydropterin synthase QueD [Acidobacteriota bacterium]|nr:6-carboxytetrahydropterin synthase QueD [Blastocatellia bacterium]MDW8413540.1 6-carboxytetrahydropterin synthase QueD [Acidobacteriota bacterium]
MFQVTKEIDFCYGHRLRDYAKKCKHLHGHNGRVEITLQADSLDHRGMLVDFEDIKEGVKSWIMSELDHKLLLRKDDPLIPVLRDMNEVFLAMEDNPTAENIAKMIYEYTKSKGFPVVSVKLWETPTSFAVYTEVG